MPLSDDERARMREEIPAVAGAVERELNARDIAAAQGFPQTAAEREAAAAQLGWESDDAKAAARREAAEQRKAAKEQEGGDQRGPAPAKHGPARTTRESGGRATR